MTSLRDSRAMISKGKEGIVNPSNIDLQSLPWLPLEEKTAFPSKPAIYFAIDSLGNIQYIGRSSNVRARWGKHHKYAQLSLIGGVKIAYLFIDLPELLPEIESALIAHFDPPLNMIRTDANEGDRIRSQLPLVFKLKDVRLQRGLSQNELARLCEMSVTNIQKYEQQKMKSIPFDTLALFCEVLTCEPRDLFEKATNIKRD